MFRNFKERMKEALEGRWVPWREE